MYVDEDKKESPFADACTAVVFCLAVLVVVVCIAYLCVRHFI